MASQEGIFKKTDDSIEKLSNDARDGLLLLCLIDENIDLLSLSEFVKSPEAIDELIQFSSIQADSKTIRIKPNHKEVLLEKFKWSEKVKASEILANYFNEKAFDAEKLGDLWLMAGKREKAKFAFLNALNHNKINQLHQHIIRTGEKVLNIGASTEEEETDVLQSLLLSYECCGELSAVIQIRKKLLEKPVIQHQDYVYASLLRALAIDYSKQKNWNLYKKLREDAGLVYRKNKNFLESSGEFVALANRAVNELNIKKGLDFAEAALKDAHLSGQMEQICKSMAIKSFVTAMDGDYKLGHQLAEEALQLALRNNLLEAAAFAYRKLAGTYEYASDFKQAKVVYNEALHFCENEKMDVQMQMCYSCLSWIFLRLGEWKKAIEVCTSLINDPVVHNSSKSTAHCIIAIIKSLRGEIRSAEKHTLNGIFLSQKEQFMLMYHLLHLPMAKINELKDNLEGAKEWYCKIIDEWHQTGEKHDVLLSLMDAAMFFYEQGDQAYLKKCLEIFSFICKETGNNEAMGCLAYGLGLDAFQNSKLDSALIQLEEAKDHLKKLNIPYQLVLVEFHLGLVYLSIGNKVKGQKILMDVQAKAKKMGLSPMILKINKKIENFAPQHEGYHDVLTRRQLNVLKLLSDGLSNKEIAACLFLSPRTVDMHVRYIFEKFYCRTRTEAVKIGLDKGLIN